MKSAWEFITEKYPEARDGTNSPERFLFNVIEILEGRINEYENGFTCLDCNQHYRIRGEHSCRFKQIEVCSPFEICWRFSKPLQSSLGKAIK